MENEHPAGGIGHNEPPYEQPDPDLIRALIAGKYAGLGNDASDLWRAFEMLPQTVDDGTLSEFATLSVRIRDFEKKAKHAHDEEKRPYLRSGQMIDQFFKKLVDDLAPAARGVSACINEYQQAKLAAERRKLEEERRVREAEEKAARERLAAQERARAEAEAAAARGRNEARIAENHRAAEEAAAAIPQLQQQARQASQAAEDARIEATRKPADLVRQRTDEGRIVTMKQVPTVRITDRYALPMDQIIELLGNDVLERAVLAIWKRNGYRGEISGAACEMREVADVR